MFHLSNPTCGILSIKFLHLNLGETGVTRKGVGMKGHMIGRFLTFRVEMFFKGGRAMGLFQPLGEGGQFSLNIDQFACNFSL
jgi:hypothetical protein